MAVKQMVVLGLLGVSLSSQAALFDDKEARKKILEVETKTLANDQSHDNAISELKKNQAAIEKRLLAIEAVIQGQGLVDMQNQIEQLKQELAQVRGDLEVAAHNLEATQQRQKDLYTDTDTRLRKIEGGTISEAQPTSTPAAVEEKDSKAFADADALSQSAKHKEAFAAYDLFLKDYPSSKLVPDALYGMGYSQFALKNYKSAIATQQKLVDGHAGHAKVPEAMYNIANSQIQLGQVSNAKKTLKDLIAQHPNAEVTPSAQKRLKALEALK
ncbi:MAG TPA: YbgF trimerization domain-containing protein [Methylophilus sp.]